MVVWLAEKMAGKMVGQMAAWWVAGKAGRLGVLKVDQRVVQLAD